MKIQLFKDSDDKWRWRLRAKNGAVLATSEAYSSKDKAKQTASAVHDAFRGAKVSVTYAD